MPPANPGIGIVLLAAGGSSRMGTPKQLLPLGGKTLVRRAAETALATEADPVVVVTGAEAERVREELAGLNVWIVENQDWREGMGTSIREGVAALAQTEVEAALITLCDQPLISSADLSKLISVSRSHGGTIVAPYDEVLGAPVLFPRQWFALLQSLRGDQGPRHLLMSNASVVRWVSLDAAAVDIDTREAYAQILRREM